MANCIFCDIIAGVGERSLVHEDDEVIVIKDAYPQAPIHLLVIPKTHVVDFDGLLEPLRNHLFAIVAQVIRDHRIVKYKIVNRGGGAQEVHHVHIHIMGSARAQKGV